MLRLVIGIIVGDIIFAGSAAALFYFSHIDPHDPTDLRFAAVSIGYGTAFAMLAGFIAGLIGGRADSSAGLVLGAIIAVSAAASLIARPGMGAIWSQASALVVMSPAAFMGDWLRKTRKPKDRK